MPPLHEQRDLECPHCDGTLFIAVVAIRVAGGGGMIYPPRGHQCVKCHNVLDVADLLRKTEIRQLEQELKDKQARLLVVKQPASMPNLPKSSRS